MISKKMVKLRTKIEGFPVYNGFNNAIKWSTTNNFTFSSISRIFLYIVHMNECMTILSPGRYSHSKMR